MSRYANRPQSGFKANDPKLRRHKQNVANYKAREQRYGVSKERRPNCEAAKCEGDCGLSL